MTAQLPADEAKRLEALRQCEILDTAPEGVFDDITRLAAEYLQAPISLVSLIDETRQWFKSNHGLAVSHTPRDLAFCAHAILKPGEVFEIPDATKDPRFADNPLVTDEPNIRFYAGVPLVTDGQALGTLNVIDRRPRTLSKHEKEILTILARQVTLQLELRRKAHELRVEVEGRTRSEAKLRGEYEQVIEELRQSKAFSEHVTQIMPSVLYVYDLAERRNIFVNRQISAALGYDPEALLESRRDPVARLMHPDDQAAFGAHMARVQSLRDAAVAEFTYRMRHANGEWRWFQSRDAVMTRNEDGSVQRIVGTATDITAIKQAEVAMRASEQRFRTLAESSAVGIAAADADAMLSYVNERAAALMGQPRDACLGEGWVRLLHPEDRERVIAAWRSAVARRAACRCEFRFRHDDGGIVSVIWEGRPVAPDQSQAASYVATLVDITGQKELDQHRMARAAAEQANKAKSEFLARMSHELRTPLNAVLGFAQLMQLDLVDAKQAERLALIRHAGEHLLEMIKEILDLARIEAGGIKIDPVPVRLTAAFSQCTKLIEPLAERAQVAVHNAVEPDNAVAVLADATRLNEILLNLLSNAVKYNRRGGTVRLSAEQSGSMVRISVKDEGCGIPPEKIGQLFQPFNRLGAETGTVEGTGLGLAIAQRLTTLMGGTLEVASELGHGSTFIVELPASAT